MYLYPPKLVVTGRRDSTLFVVVNDTKKTTKFCWPRLRSALYLSSVVVDKVVVIPNAWTESDKFSQRLPWSYVITTRKSRF